MGYKKKLIILGSVVVLLGLSFGAFTLFKSGFFSSGLSSTSIGAITDTSSSKKAVTLFFPTGAIDNLDQTILVSFAKSMVPLTTLDQQTTCPLSISPSVVGKCRWISTQTVEFTPEQWKPATKYTVIVTSGTGEIYTGMFSTPLLQRGVGGRETVREGIQIIFNFPVKDDQLQKYLLVTDTQTSQNIPVKVSSDAVSGMYIIQPQSGIRKYLTTYTFALSSSLEAQDGNLSSTLRGISYTTPDALTDVMIQKVVTESGQQGFQGYRYNEGDTNERQMTPGYGYQSLSDIYLTPASSAALLPVKDIAFDMTFQEIIPELSSQIISLVKDGVPVSAKLSYVPEIIYNEENGTQKTQTTKKKVRVLVTSKLATDATYTLQYTPDKKTVIASRSYRTAAPLEVTRIEMLSYSKVCLYVNNRLDDSVIGGYGSEQTLVTTTPKARIQSIGQEEYMPEDMWNVFSKVTKDTLAKFLKDNELCPQPKANEIAFAINTRLSPSTTYTLQFNVKDMYGNTLSPITKTFVTGKMQDKDKFLYIGHPDKNTIPRDVPLIVNVQSINMSTANISVCGMNVVQYLQSKNNNYIAYDASGNQITPVVACDESSTKNISIKNNNRLLSNTRVDLEKDIGGKALKSPIIRVAGAIRSTNPIAKKRGFSTIFVRSNLSLMIENGSNKKILLATTFDGKPVKNLTFQGYNFYNGSYIPASVSAKYNTKQGVYEVNTVTDVVVASNATYRGMIESSSDFTDNYDFGYIAGQGSMEKDFMYLYTERPIYKPGDIVYYKGILRTFDFDGFKASKKTEGNIVINNELGEEIMKLPVKMDKNSNFNGSFVLPQDINLGGYSMKFQASTQEEIFSNTAFSVEEYHKPVFKIDIDSGSNDIVAGESIPISLNPVYYFGGKITNAEGNYQILTQKYFFNAKDYSDFQFGEGNDYVDCMYWNECNYMDTPIYAEDTNFTINSNGNYTLNYPTTKDAAEKLYSFVFQVADPTTKKPVSTTVTKVIHATDGYVGIQLPYRNTKDQGITLHAITLNRDAQPKKNAPITIELIKQNWKTIKKQGIDGVFYNDYSLDQVTESTEKITSDSKGLIEKILNPKSDGEYLVKVSYQGTSGVPFVSSQIVYVSGKDPLLWRTENNSVTKVIAEKTMVNVGDMANYTIQSPINTGTIFVAIEKDDGILNYFTMPLQDYATKLSLKIEKEYYPNVYVRVFIIGQQEGNPLPIYKRGLAISKVNTLPQKLQVEIATNKEVYLPGDAPTITVKVTDANKKPVAGADLSLSIVDQSLLALKGNPIKNPFAYFYDMKRYLGTYTRLSLNTLVDKLEIKDTSDGSKGGDGGSLKGGNSRKKRGVFKDTAYWNATITTDAQGQAKITADALPDNLTTWVIEALVNTPDTKVGIATDTIQSALPLMINPNLPNILSVNDTVVFHPVIFNKTDKEQLVSFTMSGSYLNILTPTQKITIPSQGQVALDITATVTGNILSYMQPGASKIQMIATTSDVDVRDELEIYVPVVYNVTTETVTTVGVITGGKATEQLGVPEDLQGSLALVYSKSLFGSLLDGISSPTQSTYTCLEQRFSSFMSHIYIKKLFLSANKGDAYNFNKIYFSQWIDQFDGYKKTPLSTYIKSQLASVKKYQNIDGGFMFRYDTTIPQKSSVWLTNYIISSLAALRDVGYTIADDISTDAISYLKQQFYADQKLCIQKKISCTTRAQQGMDTLSALVDFAPKDNDAKKMWELIVPYIKDNTSVNLLLQEALLLGKLGQTKDIPTILNTVMNNQLVMEPKTAYIGKYSSYQNILYTAYFLEASTYAPEFISEHTVIYEALQRWLAEQKKNGMRGSTQETIEVMKSLTRFLIANPIPEKTMTINTTIGSTKLGEITLPKSDPFVTKKLQTNLSDISHQAKVSMQSSTKETSYYDLTMTYFLSAKDVPSRDEGFVLQKKYYAYESYMDIARKKSVERSLYLQNKISYKALKYPKAITEYLSEEKAPKIGEVLVANITFVTSEPREQVAIDNYIPAGTELINPNLSTESTYKRQSAGYGYSYDGSPLVQEYTPINIQTFTCDKEEFRTEKYFCYVEHLNPGTYTLMALIRVTHAGVFAIRPTMIFEFYHPENFGRSFGQQFTVSE